VARFGEKEGVRVKPFNYTGRKVITEKAFQLAVKIEFRRVRPLKGIWKGDNYGYQERYVGTWEAEVRKEVIKTLCSINDITDHVIKESTDVYVGSARAADFLIFHAGLTCWWTSESQDYIASKGFLHRQLCCVGDTNKGTRYERKVVGGSPEICRGLDAYGFSDFKRSTERMRALTSVYDIKDPRRFNFGTPAQVWRTMERCWTLEPTSERIIADIEDFGNVLELIVEFKGCVVPECRLRHGHRQQAHNGGRVLKRKVSNRQRKHLLRMGPVHFDVLEALEILLRNGPAEEELAPAELQEALVILEEALDDISPVEHDEDDDDFEDQNSPPEALI
jgi:hypothetical protein